MGASPLPTNTLGLIRNFFTNHIIPQFHVVYGNLFESVHASSSEAPASCPGLFTFSCFKSDFFDEYFVPTLPYEWLTSQQQQRERTHCSQYGPVIDDILYVPDTNYYMLLPDRAPPAAFERALPDSPLVTPPDSPQRERPLSSAAPPLLRMDNDPNPESPMPHRVHCAPQCLGHHILLVVFLYCQSMMVELLLTHGQAYNTW